MLADKYANTVLRIPTRERRFPEPWFVAQVEILRVCMLLPSACFC
jgi:hypothetical protein